MGKAVCQTRRSVKRTVGAAAILINLCSGSVGAVIGAVIVAVIDWYPMNQQVSMLNKQISIMNSSLEAQRDEIEIMRKSLERKANLIMTVVPSYALTILPLSNGTMEKRNFTLTLSRTKNFTFTIYVSNVGDAFAHLLCYAVCLTLDSNYTCTSIPNTETIVLPPHNSTTFEYLFVPLDIPTDILLSARYLSLTFMVTSAETTIEKVVLAQF